MEENFVKKDNNVPARIEVKDEDPNITSSVECRNSDDIHEVIIEATSYRGLTGDYYPKSTVYVGHTDTGSEIKLSAYDADEDSDYQNELSISAFGGVKINGSDVITKDTVDESGILTTNEYGIVNKSELTIGNFEIKNDKLYNYALEGHITFSGDGGMSSYIITAEMSGTNVVLDSYSGEFYFYPFTITSCVNEESGYEEDAQSFIGKTLFLPAGYLNDDYRYEYENSFIGSTTFDVVDFVDDSFSGCLFMKVVSTGDDFEYDTVHNNNITITRSVPFSLKHTSKALLNGYPIVTKDLLDQTVSSISAYITGLESRIKDLENKIQQ